MGESEKIKDNGVPIKSSINKYITTVFTFILYIGIPYTMSLYVFTIIEDKYNLLKYHRIIYLFIFVLIVIGGSAVIITLFDRLVTAYKNIVIPKSKKERQDIKKSFLSKFIVVNILIPVCISLAIALIPISGETVLTRFIKYIRSLGEYSFLAEITQTVSISDKIDTKIEGVKVLKTIQTDMALQELFKVMQKNTAYVNDSEFYNELSGAIASYNMKSTKYLLEAFSKYAEKYKRNRRAGKIDLHNKYIESGFTRMKDDITDRIVDQDQRKEIILSIDKIEITLRNNFQELAFAAPEMSARLNVLDLILDSFLEMDELKFDKDIYYLAKSVSLDNKYSDTTRGKAIVLLGKQGSEEDFLILINFLTSESETLKVSALKGIRKLHERLKRIKEKETEVVKITRDRD